MDVFAEENGVNTDTSNRIFIVWLGCLGRGFVGTSLGEGMRGSGDRGSEAQYSAYSGFRSISTPSMALAFRLVRGLGWGWGVGCPFCLLPVAASTG